MKTRREEYAALVDLAYRAKLHHLPGAEVFLAERKPAALRTLRELSQGERQPSVEEPIVCILHRGRLRQPDNLIVHCADCGEAIEVRPDVPDVPKLCAICALRRARGDA